MRDLREMLRALRTKQVGRTARLINDLHRVQWLQNALRWSAARNMSDPLASALVGYFRAYPSLSDANLAITGRENGGHAATKNIQLHANLSNTPRPSDYAALYHIQANLPQIHKVFDVGANAGYLYYLFATRLPLPPDFTWIAQDLPDIVAEGRRLANQRGETRLSFTTDLAEADGCDLLFACGSLHYLPTPLASTISGMKHKPRFILINRTPLTDGAPYATIQEGPGLRVACMIYNRTAFLRSLEQEGYEVVDQWAAHELSIRIPFDPARDLPHYVGAMLKRIDAPAP